MKYAWFYQTPLGEVGIAEEGGAVTNLFFGKTVRPQSFELRQTPLLEQAGPEPDAYFRGTRQAFGIPLRPEGTPFERAVWELLLTIPYGETATYGELAKRLGKPAACRAVGRANGRNPISILIPCHRVIGANGKLTGYAGGIPAKEFLLKLERAALIP